ncbi:hypothetical protein D7Y27_32900 [Corallococcus sp. AB004]|nr:hypothetical protein D7Y04_09155 [Corallococcus sp. AB038B]RKI34608.1 hypothetical protein D7Y27_32900 [Corallococcus sp. AB004]
MSKWLAVMLGVVIGFGTMIPAFAMAVEPDARPDDYPGPCYLSLICENGMTVSCTGQYECDYRSDSPGSPGWVRCDGAGYSCGGDSW